MASPDIVHVDVAIIGGGITGYTLACLLGRAGISTALVDPKDPHIPAPPDGRAFAMAYGSYRILEEAGIWQHLEHESAPILDIRTSDQDSLACLDYSHTLVGNNPMGYMIYADHLHQGSIIEARTTPHLQILAPHTVEQIVYTPHHARIQLKAGLSLQTSLVVAADGKHSPTRKAAGIKTITHNYNQTAITCTIEHSKHHHYLAQERFLSTGPFAVLPLKGGYHSSLVWTEHTDLAPLYMHMNDTDCLKHILKRTGTYLGELISVTPRIAFPLILIHARTYTAPRLVLAGDAGHGIHPLAGQGLNIGIRDTKVLTTLLIKQHRLGLDIGSPALLKQYNSLRRADSWSLISITHGLNRLFASPALPVKWARRIGMSAIQHMPGLKAAFIRHAMGELSL